MNIYCLHSFGSSWAISDLQGVSFAPDKDRLALVETTQLHNTRPVNLTHSKNAKVDTFTVHAKNKKSAVVAGGKEKCHG